MMRHLLAIFLLGTALSTSLCFADIRSNPALTLWQFETSETLALSDIINTPESEWIYLENNVTKTHFLRPEYWKAATGNTLWIKIDIPDTITSQRIWFEMFPNAGLDGQLALHTNNGWQWEMPVGRKDGNHSTLPASYLTFILDEPQKHKTVYLKLQTSQVFHFKINVKTNETQLNDFVQSNLLNGIVLGFLLLALIYNLAIGIKADEKMYLYYAFYVFCTGLYFSVMFGYPRLAFPEWGGSAIFSNLSALIAMLSGTIFIRELLNSSELMPKIDLILKTQQIIIFVSVLFVGLVSDVTAFALAEILGISAPLVILVSGIFAYRYGHPYALYFLVAWTLFLLSTALWAWMWLGIVEVNLNLFYLFLFGGVLEMVLIALLLGYRYSHFKKQTESLSETKLKYQIESETDGLTGVFNRKGFIDQVEELISSDASDGIWLSIDIDHFQNYNTRHGFNCGDKLLTAFGNMLSTKVQREDFTAALFKSENKSSYRRGVAGRVGGEEFAIFLVNCPAPHAKLYAERLLREFENLVIKKSDGSHADTTTISIGAATLKQNDTLESLWHRADKLLNKAKTLGRNRVIHENDTEFTQAYF